MTSPLLPVSPLLLSFCEHLAATFSAELLHAALLLLVVAAALRLLPAVSAATRSVVWTGVLLVVTMSPFVTTALRSGPVPLAGHAMQIAPAWSVALAAVWLVWSLCRSVALVADGRRLLGIWHGATPIADADEVAAQARLVAGGGVRPARLCVSTDVARPSVIGFFAPRILIPAGLYPKLTAMELEHIVLHEMEHLRRRDDWRNLAQKLALVIFPLNPALLWLDRRLAVERELACDESVLEATRAPKSYASCLVHLAEESAFGRQLSLALGAWERRTELARRVHGILAYRSDGQARGGAGKASAAALFAATVMLGTVLARTPNLVTFAAPQPVLQAGVDHTNLPAQTGAAYRAVYQSASFERATANQARMVETVARMPLQAHVARVRLVAKKKPVHLPRMRRAASMQVPEKRLVLTSWVVSFDEVVSFDGIDRRSIAATQFTFAIFDPSVPSVHVEAPTGLQVLSTDARPVVGGIFFIQL